MNPFSNLGLDSWILRLCERVNYSRPTNIQKLAIPSIIKGEHVIVNAETGSGKTATFAFPILQKLAKDPYGIFAMILTPNRELAFQIYEQLLAFGNTINLKCCCLVGGMDMLKQSQELSKIPHIIVGTPGRVTDLIKRNGKFREYLQNIQFLVLDEADRIFEPSMLVDLKEIVLNIPEKRQNILTSATITNNLKEEYKTLLLGENKINFLYFNDNREIQTVSTLTQNYVFVPESLKDFYFFFLLKKFENITCIIFVNTCKQCHLLHLILKEIGVSSSCLHSFLTQHKRYVNLKKFKSSQTSILVTTDVASRGLDIPTVDLVINYDIPRNPTDYVHRVGRTARKGKRGLAISLVSQYDIDLILKIEENIKTKLEKMEIQENQALELMSKITKAKKLAQIKMHEQGMYNHFEKEKMVRLENRKLKNENKLEKKGKVIGKIKKKLKKLSKLKKFKIKPIKQ